MVEYEFIIATEQ